MFQREQQQQQLEFTSQCQHRTNSQPMALQKFTSLLPWPCRLCVGPYGAPQGQVSVEHPIIAARQVYMLLLCAAATLQFVVVELCEDIRINTVQLANFEFFSGVFKEFTMSVAKMYAATKVEGWTVVGKYVGKNVHGVQVSTFFLYLPLGTSSL
jgi:hypothetical protein